MEVQLLANCDRRLEWAIAALSISEVAVMWRSTARKACAVDWAAPMCGVQRGAVERSVAIDWESWCTTADDGDGADATGRALPPPGPLPPPPLLPGALIARDASGARPRKHSLSAAVVFKRKRKSNTASGVGAAPSFIHRIQREP